MGTKADIELLFGVKGGGSPSGESGKKIQNQLNNIINHLEPCKIEVQINTESVKNCQRYLSNLTGFAQSEAAKIRKAYEGIEFPSAGSTTQNGSSGGNSGTGNSSKHTRRTSKKNVNHIIVAETNEMYEGLAKLQEQELKLKKIVNDFKAAESDAAKSAVAQANAQLEVIKSTKEELRGGQIQSDALSKSMEGVAARTRQLTAEAKLLGEEARNSAKNIDFSVGSEANNKALTETSRLLSQTRKDYKAWTAARTGDTSEAYSGLETVIEELEQLHEELRRGDIDYKEYKNRISELKSNIDGYNFTIKSAGKDTKSFGDKIKDLAGKFSKWISVSKVIMSAIKAIKQMATNVVEVDKAMTELRKVSDETERTYSKFLDHAVDRAKNLGATLTDVVSATADFVKLGMSIDEASAVADAAIVYKNVGDGIDNINQAAESIISTMQAFGDGAGTAIEIVDRYNAVGNAFAITSTGIGDALQRSSAAMNAAGNTLDETIALITAANTIVQNPDSVGTTMKTISMYLRAAKTEAEAAGEEVDGMASSVSELRNKLLELTGHKVDIQLDDDTFKSTYQIIKELSEVWHELTDISQANILEMVGGKRNANVVSALLENFTIAEEALKVSANSAGSALAENEKYLDSIQGKIDQLKASWQAMSTTVISSDFIKGAVDAGRIFVDVLTWIIDKLGGLTFAVSAVPLAVFISKLESVQGILEVIGDTADVVGKLLKTFFTGAASPLTYFLTIAAVAITVIEKLHVTAEESKEKMAESFSEFEKATNEVASLNNELEKTQKKIDEIESNGALDLVDKNDLANLKETVRLLQIKKDLAEKEAEREGREAANDAYESYRKNFKHEISSSSTDTYSRIYAQQDRWDAAFLTNASNVSSMIAGVKRYTDFRNEASDPEVWLEYNEIVEAGTDAIWEQVQTLAEYQDKLQSIPESLRTDNQDDAIKEITSAIEYIYKEMDPEKFKQMKLEEILEKDAFSSAKRDLVAIAKASENVGISEDDVEQYTLLSLALKSAGISAQEFADAINSEAGIKDYEAISEKIKHAFATSDVISQFTVGGAFEPTEYIKEFNSWIDSLDPEDLQIVFDAYLNYDTAKWDLEDWQNLVNHTVSTTEFSLDSLRSSLSNLWDSDEFSDAKSDLKDMVDTFGELSPATIKKLSKENKTLAKLLKEDGVSVELLAKAFEDLARGEAPLSDLDDASLELSEALEGSADAFDKVTEARQRYAEAMSGEEKDAGFKDYAAAYKTLREEISKGRTNSDAFWNSAEFLYGAEQLEGWSWNIQEVIKKTNSMYQVWGNADNAGKGFLNYMYNLSNAGKLVDENGEKLFDIARNATGGFDFKFDIKNLTALAKAAGMSEDAILACMNAVSVFGDVDFHNIKEVAEKVDAVGLSMEIAGKKAVSMESFDKVLRGLGKNSKDIYEISEELKNLGYVFVDLSEDVPTLTSAFETLGFATKDGNLINIDYVKLMTFLATIGYTREQLELFTEQLLETSNVSLTSEIDGVAQSFDHIGGEAGSAAKQASDCALILDSVFEATAEEAASLENSIEKIDGASTDNVQNSFEQYNKVLDNTLSKLTLIYKKLQQINGAGGSGEKVLPGGFIQAEATGTSHARGGPTLLGDEYSPTGKPKPELVVSGGEAHIAGLYGPTIENLKNGDIVYTYDETKRILSGLKGNRIGKIPALASGTSKSANKKKIEKELLHTIDDRNSTNSNTVKKPSSSTTTNTAGSSSNSLSEEDFYTLIAENIAKGHYTFTDSELNSGSFRYNYDTSKFEHLSNEEVAYIKKMQNSGQWDAIVDRAIASSANNAPAGSEESYANALWHQTQLLREKDDHTLTNRSLAYEYYSDTPTWYGYEYVHYRNNNGQKGSYYREDRLTQGIIDAQPSHVNDLIVDNRFEEFDENAWAARNGDFKNYGTAESKENSAYWNSATLDPNAIYVDEYSKQLYSGSTNNLGSYGVSGSTSGGSGTGVGNGIASGTFEDQYKYHQYLRNTDQETDQDYLTWLESAYSKASGQLKKDDQYKYLEEIYDLKKQIFKDGLADIEHQIENLERTPGNESSIIKLYGDSISEIKTKIAEARANGIDENSDYIQDLESQMWDYEEAVEDVYRDIFERKLEDMELEAERLEDTEGSEKQVVEIYQKMIASIEQEISEAKSRGVNENDDYLKDLESQIEDHKNAIAEIEDEATENAKDAVDELVEYRIDMLKQELEDEKESLSKRLDEIKEFYNKQKEMLQDQIDDEQYLKDQAEKREAKSSIEKELDRLRFDDSAWAEKRKLELQEELKKATEDLDDFEKSHAQDQAMDLLDKSYESQEKLIQTQIDELDKKLNDPEALYNRALCDIVDNTGNLYEEMVAYNGAHGSGNPEDVKTMWDNAYESLNTYVTLFGEAYKDVALVATSAQIEGSGYANGTRSATPGFHRVNEIGAETLFVSADGSKYRLFSGGEKLLNAKASEFLYNFANSGGHGLMDTLSNLVRQAQSAALERIGSHTQTIEIKAGDIIIQGNASSQTVSEIRRAQRDGIDHILREFQRLNR